MRTYKIANGEKIYSSWSKYKKVNTLKHKYSKATCNSAKKCKYCNKTSGKALNHTWKYNKKTSSKKCVKCNKVEKCKFFNKKIGVYTTKNLPSTHVYYDEYCPAYISVYTASKSDKIESNIKAKFKSTFGYEPQKQVECKYIGKYYIDEYNKEKKIYQYSITDSTYQLLFGDFYTIYTKICDDGCPWTGFCVPVPLEDFHKDKNSSRLISEMLSTFVKYSGYEENYDDYRFIYSGPYRTKDGKIIPVLTWCFVRGYDDSPFLKDVICEDCGAEVSAGTLHTIRTCKKYQDADFRKEWFEENLK